MQLQGPEACDPIDTCELEGRRFTVDGAHRLRAAKELGWAYIYEISHPEVKTETEARLFNYKRDSQRGEIDPFKLSESLQWFREQGMKLEEIGDRFGLDTSTVSRRLSLSKMEPTVADWSREKRFSVSHLEVVASLPPPVQQRLAQELEDADDVTVMELEDEATGMLKDYKEQLKLQAWLKDKRVQFPVCPQCGSPPTQPSSGYWGGSSTPIMPVRDRNWHDWSLVAGAPKESRRGTSSSTERRFPQHIKSQVPLESFAQAASGLAAEVLKGYDSVESVEFNGKVNGKRVSLHLLICDWDVSVEYGAPNAMGDILRLTAKSNKTKNKGFLTYVTGAYIGSKQDLSKLQSTADGFLEKYGNLGRGKPRGREGSPKGKRAQRYESGRIVAAPVPGAPKRKRGRPPKVKQEAK